MAATLGSLVSETKRNRLCLIGSLSEDAVLGVWDKVAQFVEMHMLQQKVTSLCIATITAQSSSSYCIYLSTLLTHYITKHSREPVTIKQGNVSRLVKGSFAFFLEWYYVKGLL